MMMIFTMLIKNQFWKYCGKKKKNVDNKYHPSLTVFSNLSITKLIVCVIHVSHTLWKGGLMHLQTPCRLTWVDTLRYLKILLAYKSVGSLTPFNWSYRSVIRWNIYWYNSTQRCIKVILPSLNHIHTPSDAHWNFKANAKIWWPERGIHPGHWMLTSTMKYQWASERFSKII